MDNNKLRKISKKELLEILLSQAKRIDELEQELNKTKSKLESKKITIEESGSIAEAALKLNSIFENAEETAKQYLLNIKEKCKKIENETKKMLQAEKENMIKETEKICNEKKKEADEIIKKAELEAKKIIKSKEKNTVKKKTNSTKKKEITKETNDNDLNIQTIQNKKAIIEKSKKTINGRPTKTIKKRNVS